MNNYRWRLLSLQKEPVEFKLVPFPVFGGPPALGPPPPPRAPPPPPPPQRAGANNPTQRTAKGLEIPVPKRESIFAAFKKIVQPVKKKP